MPTFELPASYRQTWLYTAVDGGPSTVIVPPIALRFVGALDTGRLQDALTALAQRHEVLRTWLRRTEQGTVVQVVHEPGALKLARSELPVLDDDGALAGVAEDAAAPFVLDNAPLVRAQLYRLDARDHLLCLTLHHAITDAASNALLTRDLLAFYRGDRLPALPVQFADFAAAERTASFSVAERYWAGRLEGVRPAELPGSRRSDVYLPLRQVLPDLDPTRVAALRALARTQASPVPAVLAAALVVALGQPTTGPTVVGVTVANRDRPQLRDVVGYVADQMPLVVDTAAAGDFAELVGQSGAALTEALDHPLPSGRLPWPGGPPHGPLFPINVNYLAAQTVTAPTRLGELAVLPVDLPAPPPTPTPAWPGAPTLDLVAHDHTGRLTGHLLANAAALGAAAVTRTAVRLAAVLDTAGSAPHTTLDTLYQRTEPPT
ncbi:MAG TPA: condensation domain-containing protein [Pseudonocardiaceae bacterium]|nr:condensation domain-containing protein [Pseudonocardiaceae bacterium]